MDHTTTHGDGFVEKLVCCSGPDGLEGSDAAMGDGEVDGSLCEGGLGGREAHIWS